MLVLHPSNKTKRALSSEGVPLSTPQRHTQHTLAPMAPIKSVCARRHHTSHASLISLSSLDPSKQALLGYINTVEFTWTILGGRSKMRLLRYEGRTPSRRARESIKERDETRAACAHISR